MVQVDKDNPGKTVGKVSEFTLLLPIKDGQADALRQALAAADSTFAVLLHKINTVHNSRLAVLPDNKSCLLAAVFDGSWDQYVDDFAMGGAAVLDKLGSFIEGWPGATSGQKMRDFMHSIQVPAIIFYDAYPDATVKDVQRGLAVNAAFQQLLNASQD